MNSRLGPAGREIVSCPLFFLPFPRSPFPHLPFRFILKWLSSPSPFLPLSAFCARHRVEKGENRKEEKKKISVCLETPVVSCPFLWAVVGGSGACRRERETAKGTASSARVGRREEGDFGGPRKWRSEELLLPCVFVGGGGKEAEADIGHYTTHTNERTEEEGKGGEGTLFLSPEKDCWR